MTTALSGDRARRHTDDEGDEVHVVRRASGDEQLGGDGRVVAADRLHEGARLLTVHGEGRLRDQHGHARPRHAREGLAQGRRQHLTWC